MSDEVKDGQKVDEQPKDEQKVLAQDGEFIKKSDYEKYYEKHKEHEDCVQAKIDAGHYVRLAINQELPPASNTKLHNRQLTEAIIAASKLVADCPEGNDDLPDTVVKPVVTDGSGNIVK